MRGQRAAGGYKEAASFRKIMEVATHPAELQKENSPQRGEMTALSPIYMSAKAAKENI